MGNKNSLNLRHYLTVILGGLVVVLFFQNCGQPGSIAAATDVNKTTGVGTPPGGDNPQNPPVQPTYKDYSKSILVNAPTNKVDILVVIDNSGSMKYEQMNMADRFDTFIDQLQGLDWRVGITTTDVSGNGVDGALLAFASNKYYISSLDNLMTAKSQFAATIQRPEVGSGSEQGIKATYRSLERSVENPNSNNGQFYRSDAALAVVVVTDADETVGTVTIRNKPEELLKYVSQTFPSKAFTFHSIIVKRDDLACLQRPAPVENEGYGLKYQSLSESTNGIVGSVCEDDYGMQLKAMGQATADLVKAVTLDCAPVDSNMDGLLDIKVFNLANNAEIKDFTVAGAQVSFVQALAVGSYRIDYRCLVK